MLDARDVEAASKVAGIAEAAEHHGREDMADRLWGQVEKMLGTRHDSQQVGAEADASDAPTPEKRICIDCYEEGHYRVSIEEGPMGSTVTFKHAIDALRTVYDALQD